VYLCWIYFGDFRLPSIRADLPEFHGMHPFAPRVFALRW
jgi:hypothetical protein